MLHALPPRPILSKRRARLLLSRRVRERLLGVYLHRPPARPPHALRVLGAGSTDRRREAELAAARRVRTPVVGRLPHGTRAVARAQVNREGSLGGAPLIGRGGHLGPQHAGRRCERPAGLPPSAGAVPQLDSRENFTRLVV